MNVDVLIGTTVVMVAVYLAFRPLINKALKILATPSSDDSGVSGGVSYE